MKLTPKILLLLILVTALSFGAAISVHQFSTIPAFVEFQANADRKDVERVLSGFDTIRNALYVLASDYALRDATYAYFNQQNTAFPETSFTIDTFLRGTIDLVVIADREGRVIWSRFANIQEDGFYPDDYYDASELRPFLDNAAKAYPKAPISKSGIVATRLGPMVVSSFSVLRSDETGDSPGTLLFGRLLDEEALYDIQQQVKIPFTMTPMTAAEMAQAKPLARQYRNADDSFDWYLPDSDGNPIARLQLQLGPSTDDTYRIQKPVIFAFVVSTLSWFVVVGYLNGSVIRPLLSIGKFLSHIRHTGDYSARLNIRRHDEVGKLSQECDRLIQYIEKQNDQLEAQSEELKQLSLHDGLTGLSNRRHLDQLLSEYWSVHQRDRRPLSFILCDIDFFKRFNDNYGHQAGDAALKRVAQGLTAALTRKTDKAARYGGEEFGLLLADTDEAGAKAIAQRLQQEIARLDIQHEFSSVSHLLTLSMGCSTIIPDKTTTPRELIRRADQALYAAKGSGRNRAVTYGEELHNES